MSDIEDRLERIENKLDALTISVEHRITKLEVKSTILGLAGGLVAAKAGYLLSLLRGY